MSLKKKEILGPPSTPVEYFFTYELFGIKIGKRGSEDIFGKYSKMKI